MLQIRIPFCQSMAWICDPRFRHESRIGHASRLRNPGVHQRIIPDCTPNPGFHQSMISTYLLTDTYLPCFGEVLDLGVNRGCVYTALRCNVGFEGQWGIRIYHALGETWNWRNTVRVCLGTLGYEAHNIWDTGRQSRFQEVQHKEQSQPHDLAGVSLA